jgi:hypothetical protein
VLYFAAWKHYYPAPHYPDFKGGRKLSHPSFPKGRVKMQTLFDTIPWLKPLLAWTLVTVIMVPILAIALLIVGAFAYYMLLPTARRFREGMADVLQWLREKHEKNRAERRSTFEAYLKQFTEDRLLRHVNGSPQRFWLQMKSLVQRSTARACDSLDHSKVAFDKFSRTLPVLQEGFSKDIEAALPVQIDIPRVNQELISDTGNLAVARSIFVIFSVVIVGLIVVNTIMLGQIIKDVLNLGASFQVAGVPLYGVIACALTGFETALGFGFSALHDRQLSKQATVFPRCGRPSSARSRDWSY